MSKNNKKANPSKPTNIKDRLSGYNKELFDFLSKEVINFYYLEHRRLNMNQMIKFKKVSNDIDNIVTLMVTYKFLTEIKNTYLFKNIDIDTVDNDPNTNGYDVTYPIDKPQIIAEVKCNLPWEGDKYGSGQIAGIVKDITGLIDKKLTSKIKDENVFNDAYKFFVVLEDDCGNTKKALTDLYNTIDRGKGLSNNLPDLRDLLTKKGKSIYDIMKEYNGKEPLRTDCIYVVYIKPDDNLISELLDNKNN